MKSIRSNNNNKKTKNRSSELINNKSSKSKYEKTMAVTLSKHVDNELMKSKIEPSLSRIDILKNSINTIKKDIKEIDEKIYKNYLSKEENNHIHELLNTDWSFYDSQNEINQLIIKANRILNKM